MVELQPKKKIRIKIYNDKFNDILAWETVSIVGVGAFGTDWTGPSAFVRNPHLWRVERIIGPNHVQIERVPRNPQDQG